MYDVVNAKTVVPPEDSGILDVTAGMICRVSFTNGYYYRARIVDKGKKFTCRTLVVTFPFFFGVCNFLMMDNLTGTVMKPHFKGKQLQTPCSLEMSYRGLQVG